MLVNVRFEGGIGDHLLANRFIPAILDRHPDASIKVFSDTEGNDKSKNLLLSLFSRFYKRGIEVIDSRKSKAFEIISQFGKENYPAHIDNQRDDIIEKMMACDKFYDFHIDGLKWLEYKDLGLFNYFYHFPYPDLSNITPPDIDCERPFILTHLISRPDSGHRLEKWYIERLLKKLAQNHRVIAICEEKYFDYYNVPEIELIDPNVEQCFILSQKCEAFIGVDSGLRYAPLHFGKPTFVFSKYSQAPHKAPISHVIRWLIHEKFVVPNETDVEKIGELICNAIFNSFAPEVSKNEIDRVIINRKLNNDAESK